MAPHLIVLLICLLLFVPTVVHTVRRTLLTRQKSQDNTIFTENFLWETQSRSRLDCARSCAVDDKCASLTSTVLTSESVTCRGHSQALTSGGTSKAATKYYKKAPTYYLGSMWLTRACTQNSSCPTRGDAMCFKGRCLCLPGYYYSLSQDSCQKSCTLLQDDFIEYPWSILRGNSLNYSVISWDNCRKWCLAMNGCLSVEYLYPDSMCHVATVTAQDDFSEWRGEVNVNISYFQRTCY
ncbi:hypothetical protein ACOMHN_004746 [Nucella lapillus]